MLFSFFTDIEMAIYVPLEWPWALTERMNACLRKGHGLWSTEKGTLITVTLRVYIQYLSKVCMRTH